MANIIDQSMLRRCKKGVVDAQIEFYDLLFPTLFRTAARIVGDDALAQDIVQDSFLKIFNRIDNYINNPPTIEYAVRRIVINAAIDELRRRKVQLVELNNAADVVEDDDNDNSFKIKQIKDAIDRLAPGFKIVITLRLLENMEFVDIAARLGIEEASVRSQYVRAKQKIRQLI